LVDLDGTLYRQRWVRLAMAAELMLGHWRVIPLLQTFRRTQEELRQEVGQAKQCPYGQQLERVAHRFGSTPEQVRATVEYWMVERPLKWLNLCRRRQLIDEIRCFHQRGGQTAVVSDYPAAKKLQALGVMSLFDVVVANGEVDGCYRLKPWPDGYLMAASRLGVAPNECLVLGDRDEIDGEAARRAGMAFELIG
jgi:FMN phosphatase YigB (HAD superfamily)